MRGPMQREGLVIHLVAEQLWDCARPAAKGYDRSRIHLDRPKIKIGSRDFH